MLKMINLQLSFMTPELKSARQPESSSSDRSDWILGSNQASASQILEAIQDLVRQGFNSCCRGSNLNSKS